jgi:hypothetical protein
MGRRRKMEFRKGSGMALCELTVAVQHDRLMRMQKPCYFSSCMKIGRTASI